MFSARLPVLTLRQVDWLNHRVKHGIPERSSDCRLADILELPCTTDLVSLRALVQVRATAIHSLEAFFLQKSPPALSLW